MISLVAVATWTTSACLALIDSATQEPTSKLLLDIAQQQRPLGTSWPRYKPDYRPAVLDLTLAQQQGLLGTSWLRYRPDYPTYSWTGANRPSTCSNISRQVLIDDGPAVLVFIPLTASASYQHLLYDLSDGIATLTLNRPDQRNALNGELMAELVDAFKIVRDDVEVRAAVLTGAGDKVFCAGADLGGFAAEVPLIHKHVGTDLFVELFRTMRDLGKPTLCAANGHVIAGGMGLCICCDLVIAKEGSYFSTPEINIGAFPFMIMSIIARNVPRKKVNEMILLGEKLTAEQAVEYGLINRVVKADKFEPTVKEWATKLASKSPVLMKLGRDAMYRQQDMSFDEALEYLHSQLTLAMSTEDILEGVQAFFEKREPQWKGR